jgi:hypothetical protein
MWALLAPDAEFANLYEICMRRWNTYTYRHQQRIYWFLREKKRKGETIYKNPLYAIVYCYPKPYDWNGKKALRLNSAKKKWSVHSTTVLLVRIPRTLPTILK